jgi:hypothetical protein
MVFIKKENVEANPPPTVSLFKEEKETAVASLSIST